MNKTMKYIGMLSIILLCISVTTIASAAIQQQNATGMQYPYTGYPTYGYPSYGYPYSGYSSGGCGINAYGMSGTNTYGITPYPTDYCMRWNPPQWIPVQVMIPGRWEYRPVWVPGYATTLYRPVPGYWQRTTVGGQPDVIFWPNANGGGYVTPYQSQMGGGFDQYGLWQGSVSNPTSTVKEK